MSNFDEECGLLLSVPKTTCYVRTYKDGSRFEIVAEKHMREWLTNATLAVVDKGTMTIGDINKEYLHKKLDEFINLIVNKDMGL